MDAVAALQKVNSLYRTLSGRRPEITTLDDYYEGKQPLAYASREWADWHKDRYAGFSDNWGVVVADAINERLAIAGLRVGHERTQDEEVLWDDFERNNLPAQSSQGILESVVAKRSSVIVWGTANDEPLVTWEHPSQVAVEYAADGSRTRTAGLKVWADGQVEFATLYTPDEVWKFQRPAVRALTNGQTTSGLYVVGSLSPEGWQPREVAGETWPIPNPMGEVPVIEFENRPRLAREPLSDIQGTKAGQDAINLLWAYLFTSADHASFPARVIMGQEPPKIPILDDQGQKIGEKQIDLKELSHGRFMWLTGQNAKIGQWDAAKLDVFTAVIEVMVGHIGAQTRTPAHYFVANKGLSNVNGETLTATETPLVKKAEEFQLYNSGAAADIFRLMAKVRGMDALAASVRPSSVQWKNPAIRSESQMADALIKKSQIGYPFEYLMELDGMDAPTRDRILQMREREMSDPYMAILAAKGAVDAEPSEVG